MEKDKQNKILSILKTYEIAIPILRTPLGELVAKRGKDEDLFIYFLDGVALDKNLQKELEEVLGVNSF